MKFAFSKGETNRHGTQKKGEPWNKETVRGPQLKLLQLEDLSGKVPGYRAIWYFPSGSCWYFDIYSKLSHAK